MEIPWYENKIGDVHGNFSLCVQILNRVYSSLERKKLVSEYNDIFEQYLKDDVIELISLENVDYSENVFIPHHPVIKNEENVTTRIRIVLNCSMKVDKNPSLNEAAFPGMDLLGSLFCILLKIRSNNFLVISDIRQAFLQIKLSTDFDRNKFCIWN